MADLPCLAILFLFLLQNATSASVVLTRFPRHNNHTRHSHFAKHPHQRPRPQPQPHSWAVNRSRCDLFAGGWIRDETYPLYRASNCVGVIDPEFDCQTYGRPDSDYLKFRWQPFHCDVPRFNGVKFLSEMRGKTVMFVGDSLGRNQWESLICMISASAPSIIHTQFIKQDPLSTFKFLDYGVTVSFYRAPYLVDIDEVQGKRILRLDKISGHAGDTWRRADVLLFNTGHWWSHTGSLRGWDKMETGGRYYGDMDRLVALGKGLRTWADWAHRYIDPTLTRLFFFSVSPTHYNPSEWTSREKAATSTSPGTKNCYGETVPFSGTMYPTTSHLDQNKVIDEVIKQVKIPVFLMDISMLSALRKDGHPSIYSGDLNPSQRKNPDRSSDCSHWCLPGLPDTWNQLFYSALMY